MPYKERVMGMKMRKMIYLFVGFKLLVLSFCLSFVGAQRLIGRIWFGTTATLAQVERELKERKGDVDVRDDEGFTGLMKAVASARLPWVEAFLKAGANINAQAHNKVGDTALHIACYNGNFPNAVPLIAYLLEQGADPRARNKRNETPIHAAAQISGVDRKMGVLMMLVKHGGDLNAQDENGVTVAHFAANNNDRVFMEKLRSLGDLMDLSLKNKAGYTPLEYAKKMGFFDVAAAVSADSDGMIFGLTPLMRAVIAGKVGRVETILKKHPDLDEQSHDAYRNTALHYALISDHGDIAKLLLDNRAKTTILNSAGRPPLHYILDFMPLDLQLNMVALFMEYDKAAIGVKDKNGDTLMHAIVRKNNEPLLRELLRKYKSDIDLSIKNKDYETARYLATRLRRNNLVEVLSAR